MLYAQDNVHGSRWKACGARAFPSLILALALSCGACGGGTRLAPLTPEDIAESGTGRAQVSAWPAVSEADVARGNRPYTAAAWEMDEERAALAWNRPRHDRRGRVPRLGQKRTDPLAPRSERPPVT